MAILWLDASSGPTIDDLHRGYEISNPKAGDSTHLTDHTWLALVATAGMTMIEYTFVRQPENWQQTVIVEGEYSESTIDFSLFEEFLSGHPGFTVIVQVDHTPGRTKSDEYAEGESVTLLVTIPIHASINELSSDLSSLQGFVGGFTADKEILEGKVSTLESDNSSLSTTVSTLQSDSTTLSTTVSQLGEDVTALSNANSTLEETVNQLQNAGIEVADGLQDSTSESRIYHDDGQTRVRVYFAEASDWVDADYLIDHLADMERGLGQEMGTLRARVAALDTLEGNITTLTSDKETLEGQVSTLESTVGDLASDKEALESQVSTLESTIADLTARLEALEVQGGGE